MHLFLNPNKYTNKIMKNILNLLISCSVLPFAAAQAQQKPAHPNVVFILMDDLGYGDIQCFGQQKIETPNIDNLRNQGMKFTQFYSGAPVSAAARCVLMTGMHSGHAQIRGNDEMASRGAVNNYDSMYVHPQLEGQFPLKAGTMTLGRMMQQAGYVTGCFGKWGLGYPDSDGAPEKQGFDNFYGYNCQRQAHTYYPAFLYNNNERVYLRNKVTNPHLLRLKENEDPNDAANYAKFQQQDYANDFIFDAMMNFVSNNRNRPFFLMWTTPIPHVSLQAPERWVNYYVKKFGDEKPYTGNAGYLPSRYPHATYAAMISYFDEQIGQLIAKLKDDGLYDNTLFVFTSDNGPTFNGGTDSPWFNSGGLFKSEYGWGKCFLHEGGIRVPTIVTWNRHIKAGSESDFIGCFQDFMPTFAALANIKCPTTDGISFLPAMLGKKKQKQHEYLYWEFCEIKGARAVRMGKWKGIVDNIKTGNTKMQLFNLDNDIKELHDVADEHPDIVKAMEKIMKSATVPPENTRFKF